MGALNIYADLTNRQLVNGLKGSLRQFTDVFHQDKIYISVQALLADSSSTSNPFTVVDTSGMSLTALIVDATTGSAGATLVGPITSFTPDGNGKSASIDFSTSAMATAFTNAATTSISAKIQFQFDDGANFKEVVESNFTIKRTYIIAGTPSSLPLTSYYSRDEINALFVRFTGNPNGASIELSSPDGTKKNVLLTDTDGTFKADPES